MKKISIFYVLVHMFTASLNANLVEDVSLQLEILKEIENKFYYKETERLVAICTIVPIAISQGTEYFFPPESRYDWFDSLCSFAYNNISPITASITLGGGIIGVRIAKAKQKLKFYKKSLKELLALLNVSNIIFKSENSYEKAKDSVLIKKALSALNAKLAKHTFGDTVHLSHADEKWILQNIWHLNKHPLDVPLDKIWLFWPERTPFAHLSIYTYKNFIKSLKEKFLSKKNKMNEHSNNFYKQRAKKKKHKNELNIVQDQMQNRREKSSSSNSLDEDSENYEKKFFDKYGSSSDDDY